MMSTSQELLPRSLERTVARLLTRSPVVVLTGARQTGKTTLVRSFSGAAGRHFVTLDRLTALDQARKDPETLAESAQHITIDEVQRAPELLIAVKRAVDEDRRPGRFLLTGSANLLLLKSTAESLAGRSAHVVLRPMTVREKEGAAGAAIWSRLMAARDVAAALRTVPRPRTLDWRREAVRGGLPPAALARSADDRQLWLEGYVDTYLQRDLRDLTQVGDLAAFSRLMRLAALRTGGLINQVDLARGAGVSRATAQRWLSILEATFVITLLAPFAESRAKRLIKTPKLFFLDTGLAVHLSGANEIEDFPGSMGGAMLENLVLNELLAWRETETRKPSVFYRRTSDGEEVDFVIEHGRRLLPIDVKSARTLRSADARGVDLFCDEFGARAPFGVILYDGEERERVTGRVLAVPLGSAC